MKRMTRLVTAALVSLAALLALAPGAAAGEKGRSKQAKPVKALTVTATGEAAGMGATATATATCPGGTRAMGGGFSAPSSMAVIGIVYESVKVGQRSWRASAQLLDIGTPSTLTLTVQVNCRSRAPRTRLAFATVPTDGTTQLGPSATATCGAGLRAIAGGFSMAPPLIDTVATALVFDSRRSSPTAWTTRVATGDAGPGAITTLAYCADRPELAESIATSAPNSTDFAPSSTTAGCESPRVAFAGGFEQPASTHLSFFLITDSLREVDAWRVSALHSGGDPAVSLSGLAYCGYVSPELWRKGRSVRGKLVVPDAESAEGGPESLLRSLLVK